MPSGCREPLMVTAGPLQAKGDTRQGSPAGGPGCKTRLVSSLVSLGTSYAHAGLDVLTETWGQCGSCPSGRLGSTRPPLAGAGIHVCGTRQTPTPPAVP